MEEEQTVASTSKKVLSKEEAALLKETKKAEAKSRRENGLRRGKWTAEEEAYANRLIHEFKLGLLPLTDGTTLRTFLSKLLHCDPMRISKKFVGSNCIGKQVFRRRQADMDRLSPEDIKRSRYELAELERRFLSRVAQTNRSAKATAAAPSGGHQQASQLGGAGPMQASQHKRPDAAGNFTRRQPIVAPWLLPPNSSGVQPVRATPGAGAVAIAAPYGLAANNSFQVVTQAPAPQAQQPQAAAQGGQGQRRRQQHGPASALIDRHRPDAWPFAPTNRGDQQQQQQQQVAQQQQQPEQQQATTTTTTTTRAPAPSSSTTTATSHQNAATLGAQQAPVQQQSSFGRRRQLLDRRLPSENYLATQPSAASLTSFDLPSLNSMDNLASLDTGSLGLTSPWPSSAKLHHNDSFIMDLRMSSNSLAGLAESASNASSSRRNQQQKHAGLPSWPSFSALVGGLDEPDNDNGASGSGSKHNTSTATSVVGKDVHPLFAASTNEPQTTRPSIPEEGAASLKTDDLSRVYRHKLSASQQQAIRHQNRNSSVENFLSLVRSGDIPAPETDLLSFPAILGDATTANTHNNNRKRSVRTLLM